VDRRQVRTSNPMSATYGSIASTSANVPWRVPSPAERGNISYQARIRRGADRRRSSARLGGRGITPVRVALGERRESSSSAAMRRAIGSPGARSRAFQSSSGAAVRPARARAMVRDDAGADAQRRLDVGCLRPSRQLVPPRRERVRPRGDVEFVDAELGNVERGAPVVVRQRVISTSSTRWRPRGDAGAARAARRGRR
jgi:hypothetical protein